MLVTTRRLLEYNEVSDSILQAYADHGPSTPIPLIDIFESYRMGVALWVLRECIPETLLDTRDRIIRLMACDYAEWLLPRFERQFPDDRNPRRAIAIARRYALGDATENELFTAGYLASVSVQNNRPSMDEAILDAPLAVRRAVNAAASAAHENATETIRVPEWVADWVSPDERAAQERIFRKHITSVPTGED